MRAALTAIALAVLLAACSSASQSQGPTPTADRTPRPTSASAAETASPTPDAMPAEWEENVCLALNQLGEAGQDIEEMGEAAAAGDIDRVGLMAYAAGGFVTTVQAALSRAPAWEPGDEAVRQLSALADDLLTGLDTIDAGTQEGDAGKIDEGTRLVDAAIAALVDVTPELARLRDSYGLACVLP